MGPALKYCFRENRSLHRAEDGRPAQPKSGLPAHFIPGVRTHEENAFRQDLRRHRDWLLDSRVFFHALCRTTAAELQQPAIFRRFDHPDRRLRRNRCNHSRSARCISAHRRHQPQGIARGDSSVPGAQHCSGWLSAQSGPLSQADRISETAGCLPRSGTRIAGAGRCSGAHPRYGL